MNYKRFIIHALSLIPVLFYVQTAHAVFQQGVAPSGDDGGLIAVAASDNKYIAVGIFSKVLQSNDGINWVKQAVPDNGMTTYKNFRDITWGNNLFIGVTQQSIIYTSPDGENWTERSIPVDPSVYPDLTAVIYNGSKYFVTATYFSSPSFTPTTQILESSDGVTWTEAGTITGSQALSLGWDGSQLLLGGSSGEIFTSTDGVSWIQQTSVIDPNLTVTAIASNESDLIVATGWHRSLATSPDGQNWTEITHRKTASELAVGWSDVIWTGNNFVIVDDKGIVSTSTDGSTWVDDETFIDQMLLKGVASIGDQVIAVGSKPKTGGGSVSALIYEGSLSVTSNVAPTVSAGTDQSVTANTTVTLTGTATDSDGSISTYLWEQVSGTTVTLDATDSIDSSFTAPDATTAETLVFSLTATDNDGSSSNAQININVNPVNTLSNGSTNPSTSDESSSSSGSLNLFMLFFLSLLFAVNKISLTRNKSSSI